MTVVLVHGCGTDRHFWDELRPHLAGLDVVAPSLPGRGESGGAAPSSVAEAARWLRTQLHGQGIARAVVVGHSYGGGIAIELALQDAAVLDALVLVCTGARLRVAPPILDAVRAAAASGAPSDLRGFLYRADTDPALVERVEAHGRRTPVETTLRDWVATDGFDRLHEVATIRTRTMVVGGVEDRLTPPKYAEYLARQIPGARLELLEQAGHMLPVEHAAALGERLRDFVRAPP